MLRSWRALVFSCFLLGVLGQVAVAGEPKTVQTKFVSNKKGVVTATVPVPNTGTVIGGSTGTLDAKYFQMSSGYDPVLSAMAKFEELAAPKPFTTDRELEEIVAKYKQKQETEWYQDGRLPIGDPTAPPWIWNCLLIIETVDGEKGIATGFLIGPRTVITSAGAIHTPGRGFHKRIEVVPGASPGNRPIGTYLARELLAPEGWVTTGEFKHNYGAIILGSPVGNRVGYFGIANLSSKELTAERATFSGYFYYPLPGDRFPTQNRVGADILLRDNYLVLKTPFSDTFTGAPVFRKVNNERAVVGIQCLGSSRPLAIRLQGEVFTNLQAWKNYPNP